MKPIFGTHWVIVPGIEWGLWLPDNVSGPQLISLIERVNGSSWSVVTTWEAPVSNIRGWVDGALVPRLNSLVTKRTGGPVAPVATMPETLEQVLGSSIMWNSTARKFDYIAPPDPNAPA